MMTSSTEALDEDVFCCICGNEIQEQINGWRGGHNAAPVVAEGRCCDACNIDIVLIARMRRLQKRDNDKRGKEGVHR